MICCRVSELVMHLDGECDGAGAGGGFILRGYEYQLCGGARGDGGGVLVYASSFEGFVET